MPAFKFCLCVVITFIRISVRAVDPPPILAAIVRSIQIPRGGVHPAVRYEHQPTDVSLRKSQATVLNPLRLTQLCADPGAPATPRSKNGNIGGFIKNGGNPSRLRVVKE